MLEVKLKQNQETLNIKSIDIKEMLNQREDFASVQDISTNIKEDSIMAFDCQLDDTIFSVDEINELLETTAKDVKEKLPTIYSRELVELIFFEFYTKTAYIEEGLGVTRKTAVKYLTNLEEEGFLISEKMA